MGKKRPRKFIDPKHDKVYSFRITGKKLPASAQSSDAPSKRVNFQLREFADGESSQSQPTEVPYSGSVFDEAPSASAENSGEHFANEQDHTGLRKYGIYFDDDYDYEQHLRDPNDCGGWGDEDVEIYTLPRQSKKSKTSHPEEVRTDSFAYVPPPKEESQVTYQENNEEDEEGWEDNDSDLFSDEEVGDLPDNLLEFLDGDEAVSDLESCANGPVCEGKIDYSKMPPLEQFDDQDDSRDISFDISDRAVSDDGLDSEDDTAASPQGKGADNGTLDRFFGSQPGPSSPPAKQISEADRLNQFFDSVADVSDGEGERGEEERTVQMESSKGVKKISQEMEMMNARFEKMWGDQYADHQIDCPYDPESTGADAESLLGLMKAGGGGREGRFMEQRIFLTGPNKIKETKEESAVRQKAIEFSKNWVNRKEQFKQMEVPDPKAMEFNASNFPVVRTNNTPGLIRDLPPGMRRGKGLSRKDIKRHNAELNIPDTAADEDTQTYKTMLSELSYRPPGETSEDRRERKGAVRELRKGRREEKKLNKIAHKHAVILTTKANMNAKHTNNVHIL